jgi:hypothetical protein
MTADELQTQTFRLQADINALQMAINAFMIALPPQLQERVLQAHDMLQQLAIATLATQRDSPISAQGLIDASRAQHAALVAARKAIVERDPASD